MLKFRIGSRELTIQVNKKRGRPKKTTIVKTRQFLAFLKRIWKDNRFQGNRISRVLRRIFENRRIKKAFGFKLTAFVLASGFVRPSLSLPQNNADGQVLAASEVKVTTQRALGRPLDTIQISQNYHFFHPAVDLHAPLGTPVYPIKTGQIENVNYSQFGYGNHVIIRHNLEETSLYAHLGEILVQEKQQVDENQPIGKIGLTGWVTGPHLHLEIHQSDKPINPLPILQGNTQVD
ncbi:M23 family metallopeptidase [Patescibacteria group bacterium]